MIYDGKNGDIINQYVSFKKVLNEQIKLHGRTKTAVCETIRICKDSNVLKEYLESKESEAVDIMMQLYDQEEIMRVHDMRIRRDSGIMSAVAALKKVQISLEEVVKIVAEQFNMPQERAQAEVEEYWKQS